MNEPFQTSKKETIRLVVSGCTSQGPDFFICRVTCDKDQYIDGMHYEAAKDLAVASGFDTTAVAFDEFDKQDWLFYHFEWENTKVVNITPKTYLFTYHVRASGMTPEDAEANAQDIIANLIRRGEFDAATMEEVF